MKSNVSDHLRMAESILADAFSKCLAGVSDLRDWKTIQSRVKAEGLSFLTITLPLYARDLEQSLAQGYISPKQFRSFRKCGAIPAFLQGMLGRIFDRETGRINNEVNSHPLFVEGIRQVCLFWKKVEIPCSERRNAAAISNFVEIEQDLQHRQIPAERVQGFELVSRILWDNTFRDFSLESVVPRHGPGATAEGISGNAKYLHRRWHERLEVYFPFFGNAVSVSAADGVGFDFDEVTFVSEPEEQPVRVVLVPKTLKSPRVIAIEPVCMQYAQQSLQSYLRGRIEKGRFSAGHVNFRDQTVNQRLALASSMDGRLATIDLSDASDRVIYDLAMRMFVPGSDLSESVRACRSTRATLPDGRTLGPLKKFASMGSALCFPVESMYFYTICVETLLRTRKLPITFRNVFDVTRDVYVYGDDLLVPTTEASAVLDGLHEYACKVNAAKTFVTGKFRESCGVDAYDGVPVQPTYLRTLRPKNRRQVRELVSWVATARHLDKRGYWRTASYMYSTCEKILGSLPYTEDTTAALGRVPLFPGGRTQKVRSRRPFPLVRGWVVDQVYRSDQIDGYPALYKALTLLSEKPRGEVSGLTDFEDPLHQYALMYAKLRPQTDNRHLERTALRGAVTLKRRWVPAT